MWASWDWVPHPTTATLSFRSANGRSFILRFSFFVLEDSYPPAFYAEATGAEEPYGFGECLVLLDQHAQGQSLGGVALVPGIARWTIIGPASRSLVTK